MYFCAWSSFTLSTSAKQLNKIKFWVHLPVELKIITRKKDERFAPKWKKPKKTKIWAIKSEQFIDYEKKTNLINCLIHAVSVSDWMINEKKNGTQMYTSVVESIITISHCVYLCFVLRCIEFEWIWRSHNHQLPFSFIFNEDEGRKIKYENKNCKKI